MLLKQTVWAEEWQNYSPFWLSSSLHPDKPTISFPVGIQPWLASFRLSTQADPDDITQPSSSPSFPGALFFINQHLHPAFTCQPGSNYQGNFLVLERLLWKAEASFCLASLPTAWNATQKAAGDKIIQSCRYQQLICFYLLFIDCIWADIFVSLKPTLWKLKCILPLGAFELAVERTTYLTTSVRVETYAYLWGETIELIGKRPQSESLVRF